MEGVLAREPRRLGGGVLVDRHHADAERSAAGIGQVLAQRIVDYRTQHGPYRDVKDLLKVADAYEIAVDRRIEAMFKIVEPVLLIMMAVIVIMTIKIMPSSS